tara:strand:+ start:52780 stop:53013 length:234 start_codon:yes stop_codon:yes gene_type:complete
MDMAGQFGKVSAGMGFLWMCVLSTQSRHPKVLKEKLTVHPTNFRERGQNHVPKRSTPPTRPFRNRNSRIDGEKFWID